MTDAERKLWSRFRGNQIGYYFRRQTPIGDYIVDFVCWKAQLIVEVDGGQHYTDEGIEYDKHRDECLRSRGFRVLRFTNFDVLKHTDGVVETIFEALTNPLKSPWKGDTVFSQFENRIPSPVRRGKG